MIATADMTENRREHKPLPAPHRPARIDDAAALADLVNFAGEGMPDYLWAKMAKPGQSARGVGIARARRDYGAFSWRNAIVREDRGRVAAALIGYPLPESPDPAVYDELPAMFVPLQQLEDLACGTWYVNALAAYPEFRGRGYGTGLLRTAGASACELGCDGLSLIVSNANSGARRLYERAGFRDTAKRPMIKDGWKNPGKEWVLMERRHQQGQQRRD